MTTCDVHPAEAATRPSGLLSAAVSSARTTVVPAFVRLITQRLPSGRYRAAHLMPVSS